MIKAARIDARNVYQGIDTLEDESQLTDRHLPAVRDCDLMPGEYEWIATDNPLNEYGGAFWPLSYLKRLDAAGRAKLEHI